MILELITGGILVGQYIYHRLTEKERQWRGDGTFHIPETREGSPIPFFYGRVLVRRPILAWLGNESATQIADQPDGIYLYRISALFALGIPFFDGLTLLYRIYQGEGPMAPSTPDAFPPNLASGVPGFIDNSASISSDSPEFTAISFLWADGNSAQDVDGTAIEGQLLLDGYPSGQIPSFRGYATFLADDLQRNSNTLPSLAFEIATYPVLTALPDSPGTSTDDPNPVDVLYDLHTAPMKLAMDPAKIDQPSWHAAAVTLKAEQHGYSRNWDDSPSADDVRDDVLKQIDGVIDEDPATGKLRLKLVRADFDPTEIPHITVDNCERIENFAAGGWTDLINKVRIVFTNRADFYREGSAVVHNQANAVGQDGIEREVSLQFLGCNTLALASVIASREMAARSRPMAKLTAIVSREFWRTMAGDPIAVTWPELQIFGRIFRVGRVSRGSADSNMIALDLIEDFFYTHRFEVNDDAGLPSHPGEAVE